MKIALIALTIILSGCASQKESHISWEEEVRTIAVATDDLECDNPATRESLSNLQKAQREFNSWAALPPQQRKFVGPYAILLSEQSSYDTALASCKAGASEP